MKSIIQPSPCGECERAEFCSKQGCLRWEKWFRESWRKLRVFYLGEERANERGKRI